MSVQQIVEDTAAIELQAEAQYDDREAQVGVASLYIHNFAVLSRILKSI